MVDVHEAGRSSGNDSSNNSRRSQVPTPSSRSPSAASRGGYSNIAPTSSAAAVAAEMGEGEEVEEAGRGLVEGLEGVAGDRPKTKKSYIGLDGGGDDERDEDHDHGHGRSSGKEGRGAEDEAEAKKTSRQLAIFGVLNLAYVVLQLAGALAFNSLALMSDGFHNLSDV